MLVFSSSAIRDCMAASCAAISCCCGGAEDDGDGSADEGEDAGADDPGDEAAALGEQLFLLVERARTAGHDPELELRAASRRYRDRVHAWEQSQSRPPA